MKNRLRSIFWLRHAACHSRDIYVGAVVHRGGVAHIHQVKPNPLLDEDDFFTRTGMRLSFPARVAIKRLLVEDVLLSDIRLLVNAGALSFNGKELLMSATDPVGVPPQVLDKVACALLRVNQDLPELLSKSDDMIMAA